MKPGTEPGASFLFLNLAIHISTVRLSAEPCQVSECSVFSSALLFRRVLTGLPISKSLLSEFCLFSSSSGLTMFQDLEIQICKNMAPLLSFWKERIVLDAETH